MARKPVVMYQVLEFIKFYKEENDGNSPTYEMIAAQFNCTINNAWEHVRRLERYNMLRLDENRRITLPGGEYIPPNP